MGSRGPELAILFIGMCLVLGVFCNNILRRTKVPYTVALFLLGIALGAAEYGTTGTLGSFGNTIRLWSNISPSLILFLFLPCLIFESSFAMDVNQLKACFLQMLLLAGPGVVISAFCTGISIHYTFPYQWTWRISLLLGGLLSATDPVAVVAHLKELGASKKLKTLIEGESCMNDGVSIVFFRFILQLVLGHGFNTRTVVAYVFRVSLGAFALGLAFGLCLVIWLGFVFNDIAVEITLTLSASYIAYYIAEDEADVSGILTVMTVGIVFAVFANSAFKGETQPFMYYFWEMVAYIANTVVFILSGVIIAEFILQHHTYIQGQDWGYLVLLYIIIQSARVIVVVTLYPCLEYFGSGLNWKEAAILTWAGLRGAVSLSLALSVNAMEASDSQGNAIVSEQTKARFVFFTGGVVFLTLVINGSTTQILLYFLKMQITSSTKEVKSQVLEYTKHEMNRKALESFKDLEEDEELGPTDWQTVNGYITCLTTTDLISHSCELANGTSKTQLQGTRLKFLNGLQVAYWTMLKERRVTQTAAIILTESVEEALVKHESLADWSGLNAYVQFPGYLKKSWLRTSRILPKKLLNFLLIELLEFGCCISAAFLRAHRIARRQLWDSLGESNVSEAVIKESNEEEAAARAFLEDIQLTFPEVLQTVKTRQVTRAILSHLDEYIQELQKVGLLSENDTNDLHDTVQADIKRLLRNPSLLSPSTSGGYLSLRAPPTADIQKIL